MSTLNASLHAAPEMPAALSRDTVKLSWGAVLGGLVVTLGVYLLLMVLGLAAGLSSVDPANLASAKHAGIGAGIWSVVAPLLALFIGGVVASRTAGIVDRSSGAVHGAVLWSLATIAGVLLVGSAVRGIAGAAMGVTKDAAVAAGAAARSGDDVGRALGLDAQTLLGPVNAKLREQGKPTVTTTEIEAATKDVLHTSLRDGRFDREMFVAAIADNTRLSPADAREIADGIQARSGTQLDQTARDARARALSAADTTGKALWWVFLAMVLGLGASVIGATAGVSRKQRLAARTAPLVPREV